MSKLDSFSASLLPIALAAGLLSGSILRQSPPAQVERPQPRPASPARADEGTPSPFWLSDLRPVMEAMGDALGVPLQRDAFDPTARALARGVDLKEATVISAVATVHDALQHRLGTDADACEAIDPAVVNAERTLNAYLLSEQDAGSPSRKLRSTVADASLKQLQDWSALDSLTRQIQPGATGNVAYSVDFIVATVPDYVDSNAGWFADQSLTAIQSAMSRAGYLLDRFRLIDWSRNAAGPENPVANDSRLHERQPGALIFRRVEGKRIALQVVLLALETPTSGVHRSALRNAIRFVRAWNRCEGRQAQPLKVLGPTFSGSTASLALTLGNPEDGFTESFPTIAVVSGSAAADDNPETFKAIAGDHVTFTTTVQPTSATLQAMSDFLGRLNHDWADGRNVALLQESNTVYGTSLDYSAGAHKPRAALPSASLFTFPLHVAQLRNDNQTPPTVTFASSSSVPLNMREPTPPADQIPALRPQLTSSVVESTVDSILDTIRHERLTAIGIQATDDRDVLFLAREVKRAVPDAQLFLLRSHALYLHPDYIPYLRGTLVASTYPLSLMNQAAPGDDGPGKREPFQSMAAEGLFNATLWQVGVRDGLIDYCVPGQSSQVCAPPVWISVIGPDGYWPVHFEQAQTAYAAVAPAAGLADVSPAPPPMRAKIGAVLLIVFVAGHVFMLAFINRRMRQGTPAKDFLEWPVMRVLAPPFTYKGAETAHRISLTLCFLLVAVLAAWLVAVMLPLAWPGVPLAVVVAGVVLAAGAVLGALAALVITARRVEQLPKDWPDARPRPVSWLLMPILVFFLLALGAFTTYLAQVLAQGGTPQFHLTLERVVGGGIVSPASATLCLFAALYAAMFAAARRASLVGYGYTWLEQTSSAFALLRGRGGNRTPSAAARGSQPSLGEVLDLPAQNLPVPYMVGILLVVLIVAFTVRNVSTIDGMAFTLFVSAASAAVLMLGLTNLAQGLLMWNTARAHLQWLALSPLESTFKAIAKHVPWDLSLAPPRLMELMPVARRADGIITELRAMAVPGDLERFRESDATHATDTLEGELRVEAKLGVRHGDIGNLGMRLGAATNADYLQEEISRHQKAAFIQSSSWPQLWQLSDPIVEMLKANLWRRVAATGRHRPSVQADTPVVLNVSSLPVSGLTEPGQVPVVVEMGDALDASEEGKSERNEERRSVIRHCEEFLAVQFAFVLRDVVARTVAALFTAMLCLTLLTASHLLYSFNGRSALLTVDLLAVAAASLTSIWILVGMERDTVLSRLRDTTPGKVDFNWSFLRRVTVYGVLPLLAVIASLFPEIGSSLFGWLEPLRKLAAF